MTIAFNAIGDSTKMFRVVAAAVVGNALEAYDMVVYGIFVSTISQNFFPKQDKLTGIASAFAIFFVGYLARPLGAILFGRMGDNFGRKPALILSIWLMALSTFSLGLLPTFGTIGIWAPILLLIVRLLQGFCLGGEYPGSIIFLIEHAPGAQRGFYGSFGMLGAFLGLLLAFLVGWLIHANFTELQIRQWAWRLPFLLGLVGGLVGYMARRSVPETELFLENNTCKPEFYIMRYRLYTKQIQSAFFILGIDLFPAVLGYLIYVFSVTYMSNILQYTKQQALTINILSIIILILLIPWVGKLSDHIGRRPALAFGLIGGMFWIWPYFWLLQQHSMILALWAQGVMTVFAASYMAVDTVIIAEIVPVHVRFIVVAFAYAVAISVFGGMTPFIATLLIKITNSYFSLAIFLSLVSLISLIAVYKVPETKYIPPSK